jgi:formylglycine-generating enzyme required for sulfatase activity
MGLPGKQHKVILTKDFYNVFEWCSDWYGDYPMELEKDPQGPKSGVKRIVRGCCWSNIAGGGGRCHLAARGQTVSSIRNQEFGFRLALPVQ